MKKKYYAYFVPAVGATAGKNGSVPQDATGIADNWPECERMVKGKVGARYKAFDDRASAEEWLAGGAVYESKPQVRAKLVPGIYFDAGTGRGEGVEVSVTDEKGKNLLHKAVSRADLNRFGKHLVGDAAATNNYGELLAFRHALAIAKKTGVKRIFGDSRLVIDYWSKWRIKRKELPEATVALAAEVAKLREDFEKNGGIVARIPGAHNPADLGFHKG